MQSKPIICILFEEIMQKYWMKYMCVLHEPVHKYKHIYPIKCNAVNPPHVSEDSPLTLAPRVSCGEHVRQRTRECCATKVTLRNVWL